MNTILPSRRPWPFDLHKIRGAAMSAVLLGALASPFASAQVPASASAGGQVEVAFVNPPAYADAGFSQSRRSANLKVLENHLTTLGSAQIASGQTLKIDVLDVVLAGTPSPGIGAGDVRIARGGADWPRITLRYSLVAANGQLLQSGNEVLTDLDYLRRTGAGAGNTSGPLRFEKRLIADWLKARFPAAAPIKS